MARLNPDAKPKTDMLGALIAKGLTQEELLGEAYQNMFVIPPFLTSSVE
jgi:hypothetical protein